MVTSISLYMPLALLVLLPCPPPSPRLPNLHLWTNDELDSHLKYHSWHTGYRTNQQSRLSIHKRRRGQPAW